MLFLSFAKNKNLFLPFFYYFFHMCILDPHGILEFLKSLDLIRDSKKRLAGLGGQP